MFDLVAEVARQNMKQRPAIEVAGTAQLTQVPVATALADHRFLAEHRCLLGKVTAENHREGPQVADQVGHGITGEHCQGIGTDQQRQQRKEQIILAPLAQYLGVELFDQRTHFGLAQLALVDLVQTQVLDRHRVLEQQRLDRHPQRLPAVERLPALLGKQPHHAITNVIIHTQHIGPGVVHMVVGVPPEVARPGDIPLIAAPGKLGVIHPVVLAVHDVMPQLHILQNLAQAQQQGAEQPGRRKPTKHQQATSTPAAEPHRCANATDIAGVRLAKIGQGALAQRIQLMAECIQLGSGQVTVSAHGVTSQVKDRFPDQRGAR